MKRFGKKIVEHLLSWQTRRLLKVWQPTIVAVVGSYGKTSTKFAIAAVLRQGKRVRLQEGNYNHLITVPLVLFGESLPSLLNPVAWTALFIRNERQLRRAAPYDVAVIELGTDGPGQIAEFNRYLHCNITVVTSISYEHMEFFADLDAVGEEEFAVQQFSDTLLVNAELCDATYYEHLTNVQTYALQKPADYTVKVLSDKDGSFQFSLAKDGKQWLEASMPGVAQTQLYSAVAAAAVAGQLGLDAEQITKGLAAMQPVAGRMQQLKGISNSLILDESYNASPDAVKAALDTLYALKAPHKIALLGNMNELGGYAPQAHTDIGEYCDPKHIDLLVTLGKDANEFLAPAAQRGGCQVKTCTSPYEAGEYLKQHIQAGSAVLVKGSQNGVFAEEAIKSILRDPADAQLLVRQSKHWLAKKRKQFPAVP